MNRRSLSYNFLNSLKNYGKGQSNNLDQYYLLSNWAIDRGNVHCMPNFICFHVVTSYTLVSFWFPSSMFAHFSHELLSLYFVSCICIYYMKTLKIMCIHGLFILLIICKLFMGMARRWSIQSLYPVKWYACLM
mgnify:CR=1 FL=1